MRRFILGLALWLSVVMSGVLSLGGTEVFAAESSSDVVALSPRQRAQQANDSFRSANYLQAIEIFKSLEADGVVSGALLYNLGNAYYRAGQFAPALAAYKGALRFLPRDGDLLANLEAARKHRRDAIEEKPQVVRLVFFWFSWVSLRELLFLSALSATLFLSFLLVCRFFWPTAPLWPRVTFGLLSAFFLLSFGAKWAGVASATEAVVGVDEVAVKSGDGEGNVTLFVLHEGTEVTVERQRQEWLQVAVADGKKGWVRRGAVIFVADEVASHL